MLGAVLLVCSFCGLNAQVPFTNENGSIIIVSPSPPREPSAGSQATGIPAPPPGPEPAAPPLLGSTIEGINFDENAANTGFYQIPPDPIGAAGSNHLVSVVNTSIEWHTKAGAQQNSQRLGKNSSTHVGSFFESLTPVNNLFDPKVIYDQHAGRFVVVSLERQDTARGDAVNTSRILLAVSADDNPNGTWYFAAFNSKTNFGATDAWADYPGFAVDEEAVYISLSMFSFGGGAYQGNRLWIIDKTPLYSGGAAAFHVHDPFGSVGLGAGDTLQPAHVFGATGVGVGVGTFLVSAGWADGSGNDFLSVIRVDSPLSLTPSFGNQFISLGGDIDTGSFPNAPQLGTATLVNDNDTRALQAVWRNNNLYAVNTVNPPSGTDSGQATAHWYRINTTTLSSLTLADQGNIGGEEIATGTYTFFPSIAVDCQGSIGIGFAASAPTIYPGAYYTGRKSTDTAGTMQTPVVLAAGVDYYIRTLSGSRNRWGDYSGISIDPADSMTFWVFNEYALTRGTVSGGDGRWGTRWGRFAFNTVPVPLNPALGTISSRPVILPTVKLATDADGDSMTFTVSSPTAHGTAVLASGNVTYTPTTIGYVGSDSFTYTVDDGHCGLTNGSVTVTITASNAVSPNIVYGPAIVLTTFVVRFAGIPGRSYTIEHSPTATGPWSKVGPNLTAPTDNAAGFGIGVFQYSETIGATTFFRTVSPAY